MLSSHKLPSVATGNKRCTYQKRENENGNIEFFHKKWNWWNILFYNFDSYKFTMCSKIELRFKCKIFKCKVHLLFPRETAAVMVPWSTSAKNDATLSSQLLYFNCRCSKSRFNRLFPNWQNSLPTANGCKWLLSTTLTPSLSPAKLI